MELNWIEFIVRKRKFVAHMVITMYNFDITINTIIQA